MYCLAWKLDLLKDALVLKPNPDKPEKFLHFLHVSSTIRKNIGSILDVHILMNNNTQIDTEIQLSELKIWSDRALFYISKMYTDQIGKGQHYDVLKKCVSISILDFILFENEPEFYSRFHILEDTRHFLYTDKMEFHVIELPKLPDSLRDDSGRIELWAKFINAEKKEEFDMIAEKDPYIQSAYEHLQVISQDEQKRLEYEARQKAILDYNQSIFEAEQRGAQQGEQHKTIVIAEKMLEAGYDPAEILVLTDISEGQLMALQAARQKNMTKARL